MSNEHKHKQGGENANHEHDHSGIFGKRTEFIFSILCGIFLGLGFVLSEFISNLPVWAGLACYIASYFFGGYYTLSEAIEGTREGKFEIDFLMLVAAAGAAFLGKWPEGALLLFLFSLGHALENMAMQKARKSIEALGSLTPKTAIIKRNGLQEEIPAEQLKKGDIVIVKPNTKIPADGIVIAGSSAVNQAPITGESIPVDKFAVDDPAVDINDEHKIQQQYKVFAGTINGDSVLEIKTTKEASDSTLARVVKMVKEAEQQQSPTQQLTKKIERYYVPAVLLLVVLLCFAFLFIHESFGNSFYRAMAVLVAASPCALAISTPSAVLSGIARAARQGVLVKGGRPLEDLGVLTAVAFDKTGTLTEGRPVLNKIVTVNGVTEEELLKIVVAAEQLSDHPLALAIVKGGLERLNNAAVPQATGLLAVMGKGIEVQIEGSRVLIGNSELFKAYQVALPAEVKEIMQQLQKEGNSTMIVSKDEQFYGVAGVMDIPRAEARQVINDLKQIGIRKMIMLTGDNQQVADAVAAEIGLTEAKGDLLPEEKVSAINLLRKQESKLAMVGDGVNDAPAMAKSTVGIAMGAAGSDVALETADIALMANQLENLRFAIGLSRRSKRIIRQNLFISLGMVALLIPLTILGIANIGPAVAAHEGSTLVVVLNALRLLAYE